MSSWSPWSRRSRWVRDGTKGTDEPARSDAARDPDEVPTGQIPALSLANIIDEADGTAVAPDASELVVEPVAPASSAASSSAASPTETHSEVLADRVALIQLCLYALDRARSGGVAARIEEGLAEVGVRALRPNGERFDPALHEAGAAMPTGDPELEGTVAETEVVGFADRDRLLRAPIVTVYTKG